MDKYEKLKNDLIEATERARSIALLTEDSGTCNLDSCMLFLPQYNQKKTIKSIQDAGITGFKSTFFKRVCYIISNPVFAQGDRRTVQAEKISEVMKSKGYETDMYYQTD